MTIFVIIFIMFATFQTIFKTAWILAYPHASDFTEATEAMAVPILKLALVPLSTFLNGLSAPQIKKTKLEACLSLHT